jgi:trehalose 6-phosphate synthase/phosphatase
MRLFIVSNRLPVKVKENEQGNYEFERSAGGLATGLSSLDSSYEIQWIGWPGINVKRKATEKTIAAALGKMGYYPVFLSTAQYHDYYEGYSNSTLWPLCHYFYSFSRQKHKYWEAYQEVNALFCKKVLELVNDDDFVWVQDYQLMLLPQLLRQQKPNLGIGYFHHIPFPSYELFRVLPERTQLLQGLLGADLVAFHTHSYMRHFISAVERTLHKEFKLNEVIIDNRAVHTEALPMGINYELYSGVSHRKDVKQNIAKIRKQFADRKVILSVDRLDYSKGILHRLVGFESFLAHHPEYRGKVTLAMIVVPSRDKVEKYAEMKRKIDERISNINGKYATIGWTPVEYYYRSFPFEELAAMYCISDIALVSPLRDGMNLVAKEYVAANPDSKGVLILSEMAGAAAELKEAILINPNDTEQIADAIYQALTMPEEERKERMEKMKETISQQTVNKWAEDFMDEWHHVIRRNKQLESKFLSPSKASEITTQYQNAHHRLIVLDYDGTLVGFKKNPMDAAPTPEIINLLTSLCKDRRNRVVINSGREVSNLEQWFGKIPNLSLAAEHGACYKEDGVWHDNVEQIQWSSQLINTMQAFVRKTPGAWIEKKKTALAWHYRGVDTWVGMLRAKQLMQALFPICSAENLQILNGNKVVEVKPNEYSKGTEIQRLLASDQYDFMLAMGDDTTDESMFLAIPQSGNTIKVGNISDEARYCISRQDQVVPFLKQLLN